MGLGAFIEPAVVVGLLFGGAYFNRDRSASISRVSRTYEKSYRAGSPDSEAAFLDNDDVPAARLRTLRLFGWSRDIYTPNSAIHQHRLLSRVLRKFPFLAECWYWALIYWTYQLGRAFTAVTLKDDTVDVARIHALQVIAVEQQLRIFVEPEIQQFFLQYPVLMRWINWLYSFIHIPGTIFFLAFLFWYCVVKRVAGDAAGPALFQARRRTMAMCNLLAFVVFTLWPCMPPRLLSAPDVKGEVGELSRSYGFVDTVHGAEGASSVWTQNRFCNQYAAMPSLHFGYSLMVGLTIATLPVQTRTRSLYLPFLRLRLPSLPRILCLAVGFAYPFAILVAIVSTANHFVLDAVAGAVVCALGWWSNDVLLNLLPLEDYFLALVRIHKPQHGDASVEESESEKQYYQ